MIIVLDYHCTSYYAQRPAFILSNEYHESMSTCEDDRLFIMGFTMKCHFRVLVENVNTLRLFSCCRKEQVTHERQETCSSKESERLILVRLRIAQDQCITRLDKAV